MGLVTYLLRQAIPSVTFKATLVLFAALNPIVLSFASHKMAIIEELGLEVKVKVNGLALAEYPDEEHVDSNHAGTQTPNACHHYVESIDHAEFAIHVGLIAGTNTAQEWISYSPNNTIDFSVAFDGSHYTAGKCVTRHSRPKLLDGVYNEANATLRKFRFAPVSIGRLPAYFVDLGKLTPLVVDDTNKNRVAEDMKVAPNLGLIQVLVRRAVYKGERRGISPPRDENFGTDGISMAEKALKGKSVSHGTRYGITERSSSHSSN